MSKERFNFGIIIKSKHFLVYTFEVKFVSEFTRLGASSSARQNKHSLKTKPFQCTSRKNAERQGFFSYFSHQLIDIRKHHYALSTSLS